MNIINRSKNILNKIENSRLNFFILYLIFVFIIINLNFYFSYLYIDKFPSIVDENNDMILQNLGFNFGQILGNLKIDEGLKANYFDTDYYVSRMPLLPLLLNLLHTYFTKNFFSVLLIKNLFFLSIIFFILCSFKKKKKLLFVFFSLILFIYNPHNISTSLSFNFEEGILNYLIIILCLLYLTELKWKYLYISLTITSIFFLKSSMIFLCTILCFFYIYDGYKTKKFNYLPLIFLIFSSLIWGTYSYTKTGFFAFGTKLASYNAFTLNHAYNDKFTSLYPKISPDTLSVEIENKLPKDIEGNEWEIDKFYFNESIEYLKSNPKDVFLGILKKFQVVFLYIYKDSQFPSENGQIENEIRYSNIFNKLFFILFIFYILKNYYFLRDSKNLFFILATLFYFFPYFVGFIYTRHCTSFYMIATFYLFNEIYYNKILDFLNKN